MAQLRFLMAVFLTLILTACSGPRVMMPTPNIYVGDTDHEIYTGLPDELKSTEVPLFYVTNRVPKKDKNGNLKYGYLGSA